MDHTEVSKTLIDFWSRALSITDEEKKELEGCSPDDYKELAPSEKLFEAAVSLGTCKRVLDYGCGYAWAGIIAARSGCEQVTAVDPAAGAVESAKVYAEFFGAKERMEISCVDTDWLSRLPEGTYDGFICSNVLDVVPTEVAQEILREAARVLTEGAKVIIGLNFYLSPESAKEKGIELQDGNLLFENGVLRMVCRSDAEWEAFFDRYFTVERLEHFAWPGETREARRLFYLKKK